MSRHYKNQLTQILSLLLIPLCLTLASTTAFAAQITKVKGNKVWIDLDSPAEEGSMMFAVDESGKKRARIKLSKVKGKKALGVVGGKQKVKSGWEVVFADTAGSGGSSSAGASSKSRKNAMTFGGLFELGMDTIHIKLRGASADASGMGMHINGFVTMPLGSTLSLMGKAGLYNIGGTYSAAGVSQKVSIGYINLDLWGRYHFGDAWAGGGGGILLPSSHSGISNPPETTSFLGVGGGYDMQLGGGSYIPFVLSYNMILGADGNLAESIVLGAGYGMSF